MGVDEPGTTLVILPLHRDVTGPNARILSPYFPCDVPRTQSGPSCLVSLQNRMDEPLDLTLRIFVKFKRATAPCLERLYVTSPVVMLSLGSSHQHTLVEILECGEWIMKNYTNKYSIPGNAWSSDEEMTLLNVTYWKHHLVDGGKFIVQAGVTTDGGTPVPLHVSCRDHKTPPGGNTLLPSGCQPFLPSPSMTTLPTAAITTLPTAAITTQPTAAITTQPTAAITTQPTAAMTTQPTAAMTTTNVSMATGDHVANETREEELPDGSTSSDHLVLILALVVCFIILVGVIVIVLVCWKRKRQRVSKGNMPVVTGSVQTTVVYAVVNKNGKRNARNDDVIGQAGFLYDVNKNGSGDVIMFENDELYEVTSTCDKEKAEVKFRKDHENISRGNQFQRDDDPVIVYANNAVYAGEGAKDEMMKESKLTNFQQRELNKAMRGGSTLPTECHPTSSAKSRPPPAQKKVVTPKVLDARHTRNIRRQEDIESSGAYERPQYVTQPASFYDKDKDRLVNMMAFGQDIEPRKVVPKPQPAQYKDVDRFDELQAEIDERRRFLEDMEEIGQGGKYKSIIATEISQKIREMEVIDQKRTAELQRLIEREERAKQARNGGIPQA